MNYFTALGLLLHAVAFQHRVHVVVRTGQERETVRELEAAAAAMHLPVTVKYTNDDMSVTVRDGDARISVARPGSVRGATFDRVYLHDGVARDLRLRDLDDLHTAVAASGGEVIEGR